MGESLICPKCGKGTMKWIDPKQEDILEKGIMVCNICKEEFKGFPGWIKAIEAKRKEK